MSDPAATNSSAATRSSWFHDESTLLAELKRSRADAASSFRAGASGAPAAPGYTDLLELHRGGQGVVYAAIQESTRRRVAIKVLAGGSFASESAKQRFRREIDLAASLRHPNIIRVYDSGMAAGDNPYFVMEFVDGIPLDEHAAKLDIRGRLELFASVCAAVQFAHQRGVIHRDLKPSNIRVDSDGVPRVLDFGLAKLHDASATGAAGMLSKDGLTEAGQFMGSLPWASPEQVSGDPLAVDVRSDVYALGVMLYQAIAGRPPYDTSGSLRQAVEAITTKVPPPLRHAAPDVDGDLEAIAATALAKDPAQRYQSAADLRQDLLSLLAGEPIRARRETAWRTVRRQARRYQAVAISAAVILAVVGVALAVSLRSLGTASRERAIAERRANQRQAANEFLLRTLSGADPARKGRDAKVVDMLDASAGTIDTSFHDDPATAASVHGTIGITYRALGLIDQADEHIAAQLDLAKKVDGPDGPETLAAELNRALVLRSRGKGDEAEALARHVVQKRTETLGASHEDTLVAMNILGTILADLGRFDESEQVLRQTVERRTATLGDDDAHTLESLVNLASTLRASGRGSEAEPYLSRAAAAAPAAFGPEHPDTLIVLGNWGNFLMNAGRHAEAEPILRGVVEVQRRTLGPEHVATLGTLSNLATCLQRQDRPGEAETFFKECVDLSTKAVGASAVRTLVYRNNLATLMRDTDRPDDARAIMEGVVKDAAETLGPKHHLTATFEDNLASALIAAKEYGRAESILLQAHANLAETLGESHGKARELAASLAALYEQWGKAEQAAEWKRRGE